MTKCTFEFQNLSIPENFKEDLAELEIAELSFTLRSSKSLSGVETLLIGIGGRIAGDYILRLLKFLEKKFNGKKIKITNQDSGIDYQLPQEKEKLLKDFTENDK